MNNKKKLLSIAAILAILISFCSCGMKDERSVKTPRAENEFNIYILKVGQADAIILKTQNHTAVIDCGEEDDGDEVVQFLNDTNADKIDYLVITHFDEDHIGGATEVINHFTANEIIMPDYIGTSKEYDDFINLLQVKDITPTLLRDEMNFTLDDVLFEVYPPEKNYYSGDNDYSLVISITHGENKFLFAGDAEHDRLAELPKQFDLDHDFLKLPHHGNYNKGTTAFVKGVSPQYTVICDSDKNPAEDRTLKTLKAVKSEVYRTKDGNVDITSDGKTISIMQLKTRR